MEGSCSDECMMDEYRRMPFMQSFSLVRDRLVTPSCVSRMSARMISGALASPLPAGKIWSRTAIGGYRFSVDDCSCLKSPWHNTMKPRGPEESGGNNTLSHQHLHGQPSHSTSVVENVFLTLDFTVTGGAVTSGAQELFSLTRVQ